MSNATLTTNKDIRDLIRVAEEQGWQVRALANNHLRWFPPKGPFVHSSCTPHDQGAISKIRHDLRRAGLRLTEEDHRAFEQEKEETEMRPPNGATHEERPEKMFGRAERALEILQEAHPEGMSLDTLCMRTSAKFPGTKPTHLMYMFRKFQDDGRLKKIGRGFYKAVMSPAAVTPSPAPSEQIVSGPPLPVRIELHANELPLDAKKVFDDFFTAWANMEKLAAQVQKKIEKLEELKKFLNNVEVG